MQHLQELEFKKTKRAEQLSAQKHVEKQADKALSKAYQSKERVSQKRHPAKEKERRLKLLGRKGQDMNTKQGDDEISKQQVVQVIKNVLLFFTGKKINESKMSEETLPCQAVPNEKYMDKQQIGDENDIVLGEIGSGEDFEEEDDIGVLFVPDATSLMINNAGNSIQEAIGKMGLTLEDLLEEEEECEKSSYDPYDIIKENEVDVKFVPDASVVSTIKLRGV